MSGISFAQACGPEDITLYAIGDVHGRLDLLKTMHQLIQTDLAEKRASGTGGQDWRIIHLGDYVDRGPDSAGVLEFLRQAIASDARHLALIGNHDAGMLDFLDHGRGDGIFANNGGYETALSYGVEIDFADPAQLAAGHAALRSAVPAAHIDSIRAMPYYLEFGDFFFCHGGVRPDKPLDAQDPDDLIWIRKPFLDWPALLPKVIIHGHTPVSSVDVRPHRVDLDTHAWQSGRLSAIVINGADKRFIEAR